MSQRQFTFGYAFVVVGICIFLLYLDAAGTFIYLGYLPAALIALGIIVASVFAAGKVRPRLSKVNALVFGVGTFVLILVVAVCPFLETSERKAFFLAATSIKAGMSWEKAQDKLAAYSILARQSDSVTFFYRSSPNTVDVVIVELSSDGETVVSAEYSPD